MDSNWGCDGISSSDLVIPKINLMQQISKEVKADRCKAGDIVETLHQGVLAKRGEKFPFIAFQSWRELWTIQGPKGNEKIIARHAVTPENENLPWRDVDQANVAISRQLVLCFYVLGTNDLEGLPYRLYFTKTSLKAGKVLSTELTVLKRKKRPPASRVFLLGQRIEVKDNNDYYVLTVQGDRDATPEEIGAGRTWYDTLQTPQLALPQESQEVAKQIAPPASLVIPHADDDETVPF